VDREKWIELSVKHRQLSDEIDEELPVNPRSPRQVVKYLRENGFKGIKSSAEGDIAEAIKKYPKAPCIPVAQKILDSRGYRKLASTYGASMIEDYAETLEDGSTVVYGDFNIIGAATGRMSCSSPNLQNIPTRETQAFRECFIPKQGNKLIIGDYSQQEIFIMAFLSQDDNMIEICNSGRDIYIEMAKLIYKKEIDKKDPLRKQMKSIVLGTDYGMSKFGLSKRLECSVDEAAGLINDFFKTFPKVRRWMDSQEKLTKYTQTVVGRKTWLNPYNDKSQRNAYNNPIQGTAADMMKKAVARVHQELPDPNHPYSQYTVAVVHDEMILDVREVLAKGVAENVKRIMEDVANEMLPNMKCRADVIISDTWRKE
jgi:DNA polymerase I